METSNSAPTGQWKAASAALDRDPAMRKAYINVLVEDILSELRLGSVSRRHELAAAFVDRLGREGAKVVDVNHLAIAMEDFPCEEDEDLPSQLFSRLP